MMDIATEGRGIESCVTLVAAQFPWGDMSQLVQGPGNVAKALKLDDSFDGLKLYDNPHIHIIGGRMPEQEVLQRSKKAPANCVGYYYIR